ncbi:MAG: SpoIIE family protein phosphatase [Pirellulaceae bacterium]
MSAFWQAYVDVTGWRVEASSDWKLQRPHLLPAFNHGMMDFDSTDQIPAVSKGAAQKLAEAASRIAVRLREFEATMRVDQAASAVDDFRKVGASPAQSLADRLQDILQDTALATGGDAVGLYLLDDDTQFLKLRAAIGLPASRLSDPPRMLRGALGDLEALVSSVVTIEDIARMPHWQSPEDRGAALVVAIRQGDLPVGTLWIWSDQPRDFKPSHEASARLASERLSLELQQEARREQDGQAKEYRRQLRSATAWQHRLLPASVPLDACWEASGWTESTNDLSAQWYAWDVLPDGNIAIALASAEASGIEGALIAAASRTAWQAHCGYRHQTHQLLSRVNDTLWQSSTGEQRTGMIYAKIDPETGEGQYSTAGHLQAFVVNKFGYRPVCTECESLGHDPTLRLQSRAIRLLPGDSLVLVSHGSITSNDLPQAGRLTQQEIVSCIHEQWPNSEQALASLRRQYATLGKSGEDRSIVILHHKCG